MLTMITRPMLCARLRSLSQLRYPLLATPKVDGIRVLKVGGRILTRSFKPVRNEHIAELLSQLPEGVDGEVTAGSFQETASAVMTYVGCPSFQYLVFDLYSEHPYRSRAYSLTLVDWPDFVRPLVPALVANECALLQYEEACLADGYEGVIVRDPESPYKCGRSTPTEGYMWKWKRVQDAEAVVVGFEEEYENTNPIEYNVFGCAKRPGGREYHLPKGTLGSLVVTDGVRTFHVGTGFKRDERQRIWDNQPLYIGRTLTYSYQDVGVKDLPRFPRFKGWRDESDRSAS